jgi:hypothetical protein
MRKPCSPREVPDAICEIPPNGFVLAASHHFMLSNPVAFAEQNSPVPARATEIVAPPSQTLAFIEPGNPANGSLNP